MKHSDTCYSRTAFVESHAYCQCPCHDDEERQDDWRRPAVPKWVEATATWTCTRCKTKLDRPYSPVLGLPKDWVMLTETTSTKMVTEVGVLCKPCESEFARWLFHYEGQPSLQPA